MNATQLQRLLNAAGARPLLAIDGKIGPLTKAAIKAVQAQAGLRSTGAVDDRTITALQRIAAGPSEAPLAASSSPPWLVWALAEVGVAEKTGLGSNPRIIEYRSIAKTSSDTGTEDGSRPWCADFVNAALESNGIRGTRSGLARSFERDSHFVQLNGPTLGAIVTFWRKSKDSGLGHVALYLDEEDLMVRVLGGNQRDAVREASFIRDGKTFGVSGYWWPASLPLPTIGAIEGKASSTKNVSMT